MATGQVVNVVASLKLSCPLDLKRIQNTQKLCTRLRSNALTVKVERSPITARVFHTGNVILLGGKSEKQIKLFANRLVRMLVKLGFHDCKKTSLNVTNVVASCNLSSELDLERFGQDYCANSTYEITLFPGLNFTFGKRDMTNKKVGTVFRQGTVYVTGFRSEYEALEALAKLRDMLKNYKKNKQ